MNKFHAFIISLLGVFSAGVSAEELKYFQANGKVFEVQAPSSWKKNENSEYLSISSPDGKVSITASAYGKDGGNLKEFADYRFSSVQNFYSPKTEAYKISSGIIREYEGVWPNETLPTYYVVGAVEVNKIYVSITVVTDRKDFESNKETYIKIFETIR
jgi:hypothetical protein